MGFDKVQLLLCSKVRSQTSTVRDSGTHLALQFTVSCLRPCARDLRVSCPHSQNFLGFVAHNNPRKYLPQVFFFYGVRNRNHGVLERHDKAMAVRWALPLPFWARNSASFWAYPD